MPSTASRPQGLVARRPNPGDGRGTLAAITAAGPAVAERATVAMNAAGVLRPRACDAAELAALFAALGQLRRAAGRLRLTLGFTLMLK